MNYNALYLLALSILMNGYGLVTGGALFGYRRSGWCGRILSGGLCVLLALPSAAASVAGAGSLPVLLIMLLCSGLVLWAGTGRSGNRRFYLAASSVLLFAWLSVSEQALLPLLFLTLPWQWEFALSLAVHGLVLAACAAGICLRRAAVLRVLGDYRTRLYYLIIIGFFAVALYSFMAWVLNKTKFYHSLGDFTGFISNRAGMAHYAIALVGSLLLLGLMAFVLFVLSRIEKINRTSAEAAVFRARSEALLESHIAVQKYYHDMKHHFEAIRYLAEGGDCGKITAYMQDLMQHRNDIFYAVNSGNAYVDAILNSKILDAGESGIQVTADAVYPPNSRIVPADICSLLANLLDNAIENCTEHDGGRQIQISMNSRNSYLVVKISNTASRNPMEENPSFRSMKPNKAFHGLGLQSVRSVLRKYDGEISYQYDAPWFAMTVTMVFD